MKDILRYAGIALAVALVLFIITKYEQCGVPQQGPQVTTASPDSNYLPTTSQTYQPPSLPVIEKKRMKTKLPSNVSETDVHRVITLEPKPDSSGKPKPAIDIIETNGGEIYVGNDEEIQSVTVTNVVAPFFQLNPDLGIGASFGNAPEASRITPCVVASIFKWEGWLRAPIAFADIDGFAIGADVKLYHDLYIGAGKIYRYDGGSQIKAEINYSF